MRIILAVIFIAAVCSIQGQTPFNVNGKWGLKKNGSWVVEPEYDMITPEKAGHFLVRKDRQYGLMDSKGRMLFKPAYSSLYMGNDTVVVFATGGQVNFIQGELVGAKYGIMNLTGKVLVEPKFHRIYMEHDLLLVQKEGNWGPWGVYSLRGEELLSVEYGSFSFDMRPHSPITILDKSYVKIKLEDHQWKFYNVHTEKSRTLKHPDFWGPHFIGDFAVVSSGDRLRVIDFSGRQVGRQTFHKVKLTPEGHFFAKTTSDGLWAVYNAIGIKEKDLPEIKQIKRCNEKSVLAESKDNRFLIVDVKGNLLYSTDKPVRSLANDHYVEENGRLNQLIDHNGKPVGKASSLKIINYFPDFNFLYTAGQDDNKSLLYNINGRLMESMTIRYVAQYGDLLYAESYGDAQFYFDREGNRLAEFKPQYSIARDLYGNKLYGLLEAFSNELVVDKTYSYAEKVSDKRYYFGENPAFFLKDTFLIVDIINDEPVLNQYEFIQTDCEEDGGCMTLVQRDGKKGVINDSFELIIPCEHDQIEIDDQSIRILEGNRTLTYGVSGQFLAENRVVAEKYDHFYFTHASDLKSDKIYIISKDGHPIMEGYFEVLDEFDNGVVHLLDFQAKKKYLLNPGEKTPVEVDYTYSQFIPDVRGGKGAYVVQKGKFGRFKYGLMSADGTLLIKPQYHAFNNNITGHLIFFGKKNDLLVMKDFSGKNYKSYMDIFVLGEYFQDEMPRTYYLVKEDKLYQIYGNDFQPLQNRNYQEVNSFYKDEFLVRFEDGKWGFVDDKGEKIIEKNYTSVDQCYDIIALGNENGSYDLYNYRFSKIIEKPVEAYRFADYYSDFDYVSVKDRDGWYLYYYNGEKIYGPVEDFFNPGYYLAEEGYLGIVVDGKRNLINLSKKRTILDAYYDEIKIVEEVVTHVIVKKNDKYGMYDMLGNTILEVKYDRIERPYSHEEGGYAVKVKLNGGSETVRYTVEAGF